MIYLLEDRRDRFEQMLKEKLDENIIKTDATISCRKAEIEDYIAEHFPNARLVLLHRSYNFIDNEITPLFIQTVFNNHDIPVVIFSGANSSNVCKNNGTINSQDLYTNLPWFIAQNDESNISKLIFGEKYVLNMLITFQTKVYDSLFNIKDADKLTHKEISDLKFIISDLRAPEFKEINAELKRMLSSDIQISVGEFKQYVQNIIDRQ